MNGLSLNRWAIFCTFAIASSLAQAATYSVSSQSGCQAIPGAVWGAGNVCTLGADFTLRTGDTLSVPFPATLAIPAGVTLTNTGGLLQVQVSATLRVNGGAIQHVAGTIDNDGLWEVRGATGAVVASAGSVVDNGNQLVVEGRFDNHGTLTQNTFVSFLTVETAGVLRNFNRLVNVSGADVYNKGRIENTGAIVNNGSFENRCGVFVNTGTYTGFAVITPNCWIGGTGRWNVASNWSHGVVPAANGYTVLTSGTATIDFNFTILGTVLLEGGHIVISPAATLTNSNLLSLAPGAAGSSTVRNQGTFINRATLENSNRFINEGSFVNQNTIRAAASAAGTFVNSGTWTNQVVGSVNAQGLENAAAGVMTNSGAMQLAAAGSFNAGRLTNTTGAMITLDNRLRNRAGGTIVNQARLFISNRPASPAGIDNDAGAKLENHAGASITLLGAAAYVNNAGVVRNDGAVANGGVFNNTGAVCGTGTFTGNAVAGNAPLAVCRAIANAGADQSVSEGTQVTLDGSATSSPNGTAIAYAWTQTAGPAVALDTSVPARPSFVAPYVSVNTVLSFSLVANDGFGPSPADFVDVVVASTNSAPVADAGDDRTAKAGSVVTLDGSHSFDVDGNAIAAYLWTQVSGPTVTLVPGPDSPTPSFTAPGTGATLVFKLRVADSKEASAPSAGADPSQADTVAVTVVENSRPVAAAGADRMVAENSLVLLDGGASRDSDAGDVLSYQWRQVAGPSVVINNATAATASFTAPNVTSGAQVTLTFELVVRDNDPVNPLSSSPARVNIGVYNLNDPPRCDLARASESSLWPPDKKMSTVSIAGVLDDAASGMPLTVRITGVRQDEPLSGGPDAVIVGSSTHDSVQLRRDRLGKGNGRVYSIAFRADDGLASCSGTVKVEVPHSRNGVAAVDDGAAYDSTGP